MPDAAPASWVGTDSSVMLVSGMMRVISPAPVSASGAVRSQPVRDAPAVQMVHKTQVSAAACTIPPSSTAHLPIRLVARIASGVAAMEPSAKGRSVSPAANAVKPSAL